MDRYRGFWWSLDSSSIAFTEVDERHIPSFRIMHQGKDTVGEGAQEDHHYPFAGKDNPKVRLAVVEVDAAAIQSGRANTSEETFRPTWMDIGGTANGGGGTPPSQPPAEGQTSSGPASSNDNGGAGAAREGGSMDGEIYLARVNWLQDGSLCAQVQNRAQTELRLLRLDPRSGAPTTLVVEKSKVWVNLHHLLRSLPAPALQQQPRQEGGSSGVAGSSDMDISSPSSSSPAAPDGSFSFIWASERSGFMHLYLYQYVPGEDKAVEIRQITSGEWVVEFVVGVDQANDVVYVMGTYDSPCERHLYAVPLNNPKGAPGGSAKPVRLTEAPCMHNVIMDHRLRR
ncbi:unnamed protein product [Ectocarpus fasciculatus]